MKKTYADECLKRAEKATEGPWKPIATGFAYAIEYEPTYNVATGAFEEDAEFIAHSRTDVPELARRLNQSIKFIKAIKRTTKQLPFEWEIIVGGKSLDEFINELEAMPEDKEAQG